MIKLFALIVAFVSLFITNGYADDLYRTPVTVCYAYDPWQPMQYRINENPNWIQVDDYEQRFTIPYSAYSFQTKWGEDSRVFTFDLIELYWEPDNPIEWLDIDFWYQTGPSSYQVGFEWIQNDTYFINEYNMTYTVPEPNSLYLIGLTLLRRKR